jgi:hypothetical protein
VDESDTLYVFDYNLARMSVFSPSNDAFVRSTPIPRAQPFEGVRLSNHEWIFAAMIFSPERAGLPLQYVRDGDIIRSFGAQNPSLIPGNDQASVRHLAPAGPAAVWASLEDRYQLELWNGSGSLSRVLIRDAEWFPRPARDPSTASLRRPDPLVRRVATRSDSSLVVLALVADARWQPAPELALFANARRAYDSVIEIISPRDGKLVASTRSDEFVAGFLRGSEFAYSIRFQDDILMIDVWRLDLRRP